MQLSPKRQPAAVLRFDAFELDLRAGELRRKGVRIKLQEQPLQILAVLLRHPGAVVTREELRSEIWPADTFVDFDNSLNTAINKVREALGDSSDRPRFVETLPRRGYRFIAPVAVDGEPASAAISPFRGWKIAMLAALLLIAALMVGRLVWHSRPALPLTDKDTIVLADFANSTGDAVFDGTLRQGLSVKLEQSPFLKVVSDDAIQQTLRLMRQEPGTLLTPEVAREICRRTNSAVTLDGSIALVGTRYDLILKAIGCASGDVVASAQATAKDKDHVLDALDRLASDIRAQLGESLRSIQRYSTPLYQATTPSLEALQAYSLGIAREEQTGSFPASLPFFQRAVELDPRFASAYLYMADAYTAVGETSSGIACIRKAFDLRDKVSERERFLIEGDYYLFAGGDLLKAQPRFEMSAKLYPRSSYAHNLLGLIASTLGQYDAVLEHYRDALSVDPSNTILQRHVVYTYLLLDRAEEAAAMAEDARAKGLDADLGAILYSIAFYRGDRGEMERRLASAAGKPGEEDLLLALAADTAAYFGRLQEARELSRRARDSAEHAGEKETAATYDAVAALREALLGNAERARRQVKQATRGGSGRDLDYGSALALVYAGDVKAARAMADELEKGYPDDTVVQLNYLPTLRAKLALNASRPHQALESLQAAAPYELGLPSSSFYNWPDLYPVYVRGEAYLVAHQGDRAIAEFQKILNHRGIVLNEPIGALARLQLARAYAMSGEPSRARIEYEVFLALWKDADHDILILQQAKAEYAKLQ